MLRFVEGLRFVFAVLTGVDVVNAKSFSPTRPGWAILLAVGVLLTVGIASIYVTNTHYSQSHDGPTNAFKQMVFAVLGLVVGAACVRVGHIRISRFAYVIFILAVLALIPPALAKLAGSSFGGVFPVRNGARRWIQLPGFQLQPSEFVKVAYILALAWYLRYRQNYRRFWGFVAPFAITGVPLVLILIEPDLGTALLLVPVLFAMLFMAGARLKHLGIVALVCVLMFPLAWWKIKPYQRLRISAVLLQSDNLRKEIIENPNRYEFLATKRQALEWAGSSGYQLVHSKNAVGSGGFLGHGWGKGVYVEHSQLPDRHNDFVFAVIAHQWGLVGALVVLACYVVIVIAGAQIASATSDPFGRLLAIGVVALISTQVIINAGMAVGLMPITGMSLPFVSYGGSSLLTSFIAISFLISVSRHRPFLLSLRPFEFDRNDDKKALLIDHQRGTHFDI